MVICVIDNGQQWLKLDLNGTLNIIEQWFKHFKGVNQQWFAMVKQWFKQWHLKFVICFLLDCFGIASPAHIQLTLLYGHFNN